MGGGGGSISFTWLDVLCGIVENSLLAFAVLPASTRGKGVPNSMNCHQDGNPGASRVTGT